VRIGPVVEVGEDIEAARERIEGYYAQFRGRNR
jgi:hypothetical protein